MIEMTKEKPDLSAPVGDEAETGLSYVSLRKTQRGYTWVVTVSAGAARAPLEQALALAFEMDGRIRDRFGGWDG